jgi:hypothetical protein
MRDSSGTNSEVALVFKEVFKQIGWGDEQITLIEESLGYTLPYKEYSCIAVAFKIPININDVRTNKPFVGYFRDLLDKVQNSPVADSLVYEKNQKISELESTIKLLKEEVQKLSKYEIHYNMELELRHSKK